MKSIIVSAIAACSLFLGCSSSPKTADDKLAAQSEVRTMARTTLDKLETLQPGAKKAVEAAYGHAVFSNFGMKIFVAGGGSGEGVAVSKAPPSETFMKMAEIQAGLGMGIKKFSLVWVFTTQEAFDNFVNKGWEFGAQATAAAQKGNEGAGLAGAMPVGPGVYLYQMTDTGLALELTAKGTKYFKDSGLN